MVEKKTMQKTIDRVRGLLHWNAVEFLSMNKTDSVICF